jgi:uncharacterized caspase-like protein
MSRMTQPLRVALATAVLLALAALPAEAKRLALVIGNDTYQNIERLRNARCDARAIAAELKTVGFDVTLHQDLNQRAMLAALRSFKARVAGGDEVVFYFSGHGVQFGGTNYLIPVDMTAESEEQIADDAVPLQRVLDDLTEQKARFSLAIVDACRNNPFKQAGRSLGGRGLVPVTPATGQMIMYSAGAGQTALDSLGPQDRNPNGVFTRVLIQQMRKTGVAAGSLLKDVQSEVVELTRGVRHEQVPALYDQSLGQFYFRPGAPAAAGPATTAPSPSVRVPTPAELDESFWQSIKDSSDIDEFRSYAKTFPKGMHLAEAELKIRRLGRIASVTRPASAPPAAVAARASKLSPGGPFPAWGTSTLMPGVVGTGTVIVNADGSIDTIDRFGNRAHANLDVSDPNDIQGISVTQLGIVNGVQARYPDGATSARVTIQGKLVNGAIVGKYRDKYQSGDFSWTVR